MDLNQLAVAIAAREGGAKPQSIAQIKETLRCLRDVLRSQGLPSALFTVGLLIKNRRKAKA